MKIQIIEPGNQVPRKERQRGSEGNWKGKRKKPERERDFLLFLVFWVSFSSFLVSGGSYASGGNGSIQVTGMPGNFCFHGHCVSIFYDSYFPVREGFTKKKLLLFCILSKLPRPLPPLWTSCTTFFERQTRRFKRHSK